LAGSARSISRRLTQRGHGVSTESWELHLLALVASLCVSVAPVEASSI
jgi:hypothetical protein